MSAPVAAEQKGWKRRVRNYVVGSVRHVPCLHALLPAMNCFKCCKGERYQTLGQDEETEGGGAEDLGQKFNQTFGLVTTRIAVVAAVGITVKLIMTNPQYQPRDGAGVDNARDSARDGQYGDAAEDFKRDSPLILYMAVIELLACGACALTASAMYKRRRHQLVHPAESDDKAKRSYLEVHLNKEATPQEAYIASICPTKEMQTYGIGFRPSSDGLECLLVESIRWGSLMDHWNRRQLAPTPEELVEEAFGIGADGAPSASAAGSQDPVPSHLNWYPRALDQVDVGSAIVAVNDVSGDVGMMQLQLLKPRVTLWVRDILLHASQFEDNLAGAPELPPRRPEVAQDAGDAPGAGAEAIGRPAVASDASPDNVALEQGDTAAASEPAYQPPQLPGGLSVFGGLSSLSQAPAKGPSCACVGLEDEEPQILTRWLTCALLFGWVTLLPVLFMQPHVDRPRQHLFRQFLLKPSLIILPIWILLWIIDCVQMTIDFKLIHPFWYFGITHMILPGVLCRFLLQMQAADEKLVLEQRAEREKQVEPRMLLAIEDPAPNLLKELILMNPVALVWLGACVSIPVVICNVLTPLTSERGRMAQGFINIIFSPMIFIQAAFGYILWHASFEKLPELYMAGFGLLMSVHCFLIWCICIICSSRYGRRDLALVQEQRIKRGKAAKAKLQGSPEPEPATSAPVIDEPLSDTDIIAAMELVDCTEAQNREWELIYTA